ncbi:hypothetical protein AQI96_02950 [Streptomyces canus]|nr:hypothetical protein AQI96_02950 [Streptomyces canus]
MAAGPERVALVPVPSTVRDLAPPDRPAPAAHRPAVQLGHPGLEFGAASDGALVVVAGPGEVQADGVGLLLGGGRGEQAAQLGLPFCGIALFAEHDVEAVAEGVPAAGAGVVGGLGGGVQGTGPFRLAVGHLGAVCRGEVLKEGLDHVPGRHFAAVEAGLHTVRVALPEHRAPAAALIQARQQAVQVGHELPQPPRELIHCHRSTPVRPEHSGRKATPAVLRTGYSQFAKEQQEPPDALPDR